MNESTLPRDTRPVAVTHALLIDGRGGAPVSDATIVIVNGLISAAGPAGAIAVPADADVVDAAGGSVLPGFVDTHFHLDGDVPLPAEVLRRGVTSVRDPGAWISAYDTVRALGVAIPRLFLTGPHLDGSPPAHPADAVVAEDPDSAAAAVRRFAAEGASAVKLYYRLPPPAMRAATEQAHALGLPVTTHLELVPATEAIAIGVDGIEHVTSFGTSLADSAPAAVFESAVRADNAYRDRGRYVLWADVDPRSERARQLADLVKANHLFASPTLAVFERRAGDANSDSLEVRAFANMVAFVSTLHRAGVPITVGSHSHVPHAPWGGAYPRELELLVAAGLSPMEALVAASQHGARFLHIDHRLGTVERGKQADLVLLRGNPLENISRVRDVRGVMLNGTWVRLD